MSGGDAAGSPANSRENSAATCGTRRWKYAVTTWRTSAPKVACMAGSSSRWRKSPRWPRKPPDGLQIEAGTVLAAIQDQPLGHGDAAVAFDAHHVDEVAELLRGGDGVVLPRRDVLEGTDVQALDDPRGPT